MRQQMIELSLARDGESTGSASQVAAATVSAVLDVLGQLRPLVGNLATQALYIRALHLAREGFSRPTPPELESVNTWTASLERDLAARSVADAGRAGRALLQSFGDLLESLIGNALTNQMLRAAWHIDPLPPPEERLQ